MSEERLRRGAYITVLLLGGGAIAYLALKHALAAVLPFLIAWGIAFMTRPIAVRLSGKNGPSPRVLRAILAALISLSAIGVVCLIIWLLAAELWRLLGGLGNGDSLRALVDGITVPFGELFESLGDRIADIFYNLLVSAASSLGGVVTGLIGAVPRAFLFIIVTVVASVYFALDLEEINSAVLRILPRRIGAWLVGFKRSLLAVGVKYMRSYLLLMLMTFFVMIVGLTVLGRPYALLLSFVIALLDILPVLGVGTILIPWGIYEIALGDTRLGIGLLVLFGVYEILRQLAEPRILGRELGVHPLLTLFLVYISYTAFGIGGILLVPVLVVLLNAALGKDDSAKVGKAPPSEHNGA